MVVSCRIGNHTTSPLLLHNYYVSDCYKILYLMTNHNLMMNDIDDGLKSVLSNCFQIQLHNYYLIKLRNEFGNVSKRQQPDHRVDNSRRPPMGLQCSEKHPHPEASFSWPL